MSWGLSIEVDAQDGHLNRRIKEAVKAYISQQPEDQVTNEVRDQLDAAAKAARQLAQSGALGEGSMVIALSGHANPGHRPAEGWANDTLTVSVSQVSST